MTTLSVFLLCGTLIAGMAQQTDAFGLKGKLCLHAEGVYRPWSMAGSVAYAGILQEAGAYGKRFASTVGDSGIHGVLAFGLDSTLPRTLDTFDPAPRDSGGERPTTAHTPPRFSRTIGARTG